VALSLAGGNAQLHYVVVTRAGLGTGGLVMVNESRRRKLLKQPRAGFEKRMERRRQRTMLAVPHRLATDPSLIILGLLGCISSPPLAVRRRTSLSQLSNSCLLNNAGRRLCSGWRGCHASAELNITTEVLWRSWKLGCARQAFSGDGACSLPTNDSHRLAELTSKQNITRKRAGWLAVRSARSKRCIRK